MRTTTPYSLPRYSPERRSEATTKGAIELASTVKAQMPGTFYRRPDPDSDFYVEEGDSVSAGDTVGLIEVMKSFHEVKAEEDGTISKFLVDNEDAVDAGQDLVELE